MGNLLLDSQILIWSLHEPWKLSSKSETLLTDSDLVKWISMVTLWELTIKIAKGTLKFNFDWKTLFANQPFELLDVKIEHIDGMSRLPFIHKDPFDRMLVSQSIYERMPLLTSDKDIQQYDFVHVKA